jgi:hypothetical protein
VSTGLLYYEVSLSIVNEEGYGDTYLIQGYDRSVFNSTQLDDRRDQENGQEMELGKEKMSCIRTRSFH